MTKPLISPTENSDLAPWSCAGDGVTGYGSTPDKAYEQWLAGCEIAADIEKRRLNKARLDLLEAQR